ncbi:NUDIX hydrolase [Tritonibacter mobilis]|uniref:NUDIX hydrolase n=1 Tax=Tritonibacter mobilis TaxID=379347 RepID=UPI0014024FB0|nr:NUDIX hydrolase [Tritonibacter mobilis]NHM19366.1 NUDIX hydrolase [Tritonibacter mobilis]NHM23489.1 NUDIX hydrolase [Tritonibacter mobilis]
MNVHDVSGQAIAGIGRFTPLDARDRDMWACLVRFCANEPRAFERDPKVGHVTASAFVLSPDLTSVLLTHHAKLDRWLQLGGHCDGIQDACFNATKEAYEESGLSRIRLLTPEVFDVDVHEIPASAREPAHLHYDVRYLFVAEAGEPLVSEESHALAWVPLDQLGEEAESVAVVARKWPLWRERLDL